jgi:hypothetical protein
MPDSVQLSLEKRLTRVTRKPYLPIGINRWDDLSKLKRQLFMSLGGFRNKKAQLVENCAVR